MKDRRNRGIVARGLDADRRLPLNSAERPRRDREEVRGRDPDGRIVLHHRTVDTLGKLLRAGAITPHMHHAARDFQAAFIVANLDALRALSVARVPGTGREPDLSEPAGRPASRA